MNTIGQPEDEMMKAMASQQPHRLRDEGGQPMPKLLKMEAGENIPSTCHHSVATSQRKNDFPPICKLCNQQYKDPRLLDCLHSFCRMCLDKPEVFKTSSERGRIIRCPDCYQDMDVPPTGMSGLDKDYVTARLVEEQAFKRKLLAPENKILCQSCNEPQLAVVRCLDCNDFLCTTCTMAHQRLSKMKSHTLVTLADLQSGKVALMTKKVNKVVKCKHHAQQDLSLFCNTCQEIICIMCTILTHCKPDHDVTDIKTVEASCRTEILNVLMPLKTDIKELQVAKTSAEQAKKRLESNVNKILDKMANKKKSEAAKLNRRAEILKDKALAVAKEREEVLEKSLLVANMNATETEYILKKVISIVSDGDCHDIITLKEKLLKNLKRVSLKKTQNVPLDLSFMDFAESSTSGNNLGELLLEEVWTCTEAFGNNSVPACVFDWAKAVAARSNGDIVVVDSGTTSVITLTSKGVQKGSLSSTDPKGNLMTPIDIALSSSENILVLDTTVKVFNKEGHFISRLVLPEGFTMPKCIDARNGKIVIGIVGKILLFNEDESNTISIPAKLIDKHIAICSKTQSIIYTNYDMSRLISVDFSGKEIFNISTVIEAKSVKPTGVCTDKNGDIYIAMHTGLERGTGEIHHYSPEGSYIRFVAKTLYKPCGLSFSPIGELIVADRHSVKVFSRV